MFIIPCSSTYCSLFPVQPHTVSLISLLYFTIELCTEIHGPDLCDHHSILHTYREFITQLNKRIHVLSLEYCHWYSFKNNSLLKQYLLEHNTYLDETFTSKTLCNTMLDLFAYKNLEQTQNHEIYVLDSKLQTVLNSYMVYKPNMLEICMPQLQKVSNEVQLQLEKKHVFQDLFVFCPKTIIYQDPTSVFFLYHPINKLMRYHTFIHTWKDLVLLFLDFCSTNQENFTRNLDFIEIRDNSPMSNLLPFKYFHIDQCEMIVKQLSMYLGRQSLSTYSCPYFKKPLFPNQSFNTVIQFVENKMEETILPQFIPKMQF